jgi:hypothetical protein
VATPSDGQQGEYLDSTDIDLEEVAPSRGHLENEMTHTLESLKELALAGHFSEIGLPGASLTMDGRILLALPLDGEVRWFVNGWRVCESEISEFLAGQVPKRFHATHEHGVEGRSSMDGGYDW